MTASNLAEIPVGVLDVYTAVARAKWIGAETDEAGTTFTVLADEEVLRFWAPSVQLPRGLKRGERISILCLPRGVEVRRRALPKGLDSSWGL
ncbi:MAG: hypothetical protein ABR586_09670 [Thermoplasmatota archaeon]